MQRSLLRWGYSALRRFYCSDGSAAKGELGKLPDRRLYLSFKCGPCGKPVTKWLSKQAYDKGVIIVTCDHCRNRHLIADNLGWFPDVDRAKLPKVQEMKMTVGSPPEGSDDQTQSSDTIVGAAASEGDTK